MQIPLNSYHLGRRLLLGHLLRRGLSSMHCTDLLLKKLLLFPGKMKVTLHLSRLYLLPRAHASHFLLPNQTVQNPRKPFLRCVWNVITFFLIDRYLWRLLPCFRCLVVIRILILIQKLSIWVQRASCISSLILLCALIEQGCQNRSCRDLVVEWAYLSEAFIKTGVEWLFHSGKRSRFDAASWHVWGYGSCT